MEQAMTRSQSPLATEKIGKLILKFAIPGILSNLVNAMYNIADQIFIGQKIGMLGNAATNVAFPLVTLCTAVALLFGVGGASNFNIQMGAGNRERAVGMAANGISLVTICGILMMTVVLIFLKPLLVFFGATPEVLPYAFTFTGITSIGIPFIIFSTMCSNLIRADGSPGYAMVCIMSGAILNVILDPILIFGFNMGIAGAAWATVTGQVLSCVLAVRYLLRFKTARFKRQDFYLNRRYVKAIVSLGAAASFNQVAMTIVQITLNNTLTHYGELSQYGSEIPLACVGVISKVNIIFLAFALGIAQGCQPLYGFNYGAGNYARVKQVYKTAAISVTILSTIVFLSFQLFPRQIVSIFGEGSDLYFSFAERYFRIYMFFTFINGIQPVTSNFFSSIGKAKKGILLSLTRQIIFLLPLILIFPRFLGIDGVMYAGPIADGAAALLAFWLIFREMKLLDTELANMAKA